LRGGLLTADLGGTWLRVRLEDGGGRVLSRRAPAPSPARLSRELRRLARLPGGSRVEALVLGSRGVWTPAQKARLSRRVRGLARRVLILSDLELAHREIFGGGPGLVVIGGTGSAAYGRGPRGRTARSGGLGPLLGDEGSAFWLAREALKDPRISRRWPRGLALRLAHGPEAVRRTAALSRRVLSWAARGDPAARALRRRAAQELADLAADLALRLGLSRRGARVAWRGGLFADVGLRAAFRRELSARGLSPVDPRLARG